MKEDALYKTLHRKLQIVQHELYTTLNRKLQIVQHELYKTLHRKLQIVQHELYKTLHRKLQIQLCGTSRVTPIKAVNEKSWKKDGIVTTASNISVVICDTDIL
jgi:hypothetical protein